MKISALCILLSGATLLIAQDSIGSDVTQQDAPQAADDGEGRIFGIIPNNKTVPQTKASLEEPLTVRGKFSLAFKDTTDPFTVVLAAFYAGIAQWQNDFPTWGQGGAAYGKRFGAAFGDQLIGNYLTEAIFPTLFREDPRYFRKGTGTKRQRVHYALSRTFITRTDKGTDRFNYSEIVGNGVAAGISNLYYPATERSVGETAEKFGVQIVSDSAFNILLEFWPDLKHEIFRK
ncbi:MAG TPA: hypothetical protein VGG72_00330 [Bryobacteraceae bacterium]